MSLFQMAGSEEAFSGAAIGGTLPDIAEFSKEQLLAMEKERLGVYLTQNPLDEYRDVIEKTATASCDEIAEAADAENGFDGRIKDGMTVTLAGIISSKKTLITKSNKMMAFVDLEDLWGNIEVIVFPNIYERCRDLIEEDRIVVIRGTLNFKEEEAPKLLADSVTDIRSAASAAESGGSAAVRIGAEDENSRANAAEHDRAVKLRITGERINDTLSYLKYLMSEHRGNVPVLLYLEGREKALRAERNLWVDGSEEFRKKAEQVLGKENVKF